MEGATALAAGRAQGDGFVHTLHDKGRVVGKAFVWRIRNAEGLVLICQRDGSISAYIEDADANDA